MNNGGANNTKERFGHKIFRNAVWLTIGDGVNRVLKLALVALMTRVLTVSEFGAFTFSMNLLALTFILADLGVSNVLQRRLAAEDDAAHLGTAFRLKLGLTGLASIVSIAAAALSNERVLTLSLILTLMMIFDVFKNFFLVIHTAKNRMEQVAFANNIETAVIVAAGFLVLTAIPSTVTLAWIYAFGALAALTFVLVNSRGHLAGLFASFNAKLVKTIVSAGWPLALGGMVWGLMNTTDGLILGWLTNLELAAFYNAAAKIPQFLGPIGGIIVGATFPALVATTNNFEAHRRLFNRVVELLCSITFPIAFGALLTAVPLTTALYGAAYAPAGFVLILLLINMMQAAVNFFLTQVIFIHDHQAKSLVYISAAWIINISLSFLFIPLFGMAGAAYASLIGQTAIFVSHAAFVKKHCGLRVFSAELMKPFAASCAMLLALIAIGAQFRSVFFSIPFGALIYSIALFVFKPKILSEVRDLFRSVRLEPSFDAQNI